MPAQPGIRKTGISPSDMAQKPFATKKHACGVCSVRKHGPYRLSVQATQQAAVTVCPSQLDDHWQTKRSKRIVHTADHANMDGQIQEATA